MERNREFGRAGAKPAAVRGLSSQEAEAARKRHGSNGLTTQPRQRFLIKYLQSFGDPIIRILLIALGINLVFLVGNHFSLYEPVGIAIAILIATLISTLSEYSNEAAFSKLQEDAARTACQVYRDGVIGEIPVDEVVVGDVVRLQAGDKVPADGRVLSGALDVDQSALNGESKEAHKEAAKTQATAPPADFLAKDQLFRGTVVTAGEGLMQVQTVGDGTYYGKISKELQQETRESPMQVRLSHLARLIARLGYIGAGLVTLSYLFYDLVIANGFDGPLILRDLTDPQMMLARLIHCAVLAMSVIVMAVPEGLPMMITVVLSSNMKRMLRDNVLVRKMTGIETAGSLNILYTDKTGTLTQGKLSVQCFVDAQGKVHRDLKALDSQPALKRLVIACMAVNNGAALAGEGKDRHAIGGNATDRALLEAAEGLTAMTQGLVKGSYTPFDPRNKFSALAVSGDMNTTLIKGAPDAILAASTHYISAQGQRQPIPSLMRRTLEKQLQTLGQQAVRMLALAVSESPVEKERLPAGLALVGLVGLRDELRPETLPGIREATAAGVQVVMITGDSQDTAAAIARECGILSGADPLVLSSAELAQMDDAAVKKALPSLRVVSRALPEDKSRLVRLAQEMGLVAGMTGDGINDAPALKLADVGFAMGSGTEVAKEAGDIVILDNNFASICKAMLYGRTIFKSIRKFIIFQLTINLCAVSLAVAGPFLGVETPITVLQMLWINMVMDTLAGLAFSGEPPLEEYMQEPPKKRDAPILTREMMGQILFTGGYSTLMCIFFLASQHMARLFDAGGMEALLTGFFALFMFMAIFNAFNARTHRLNLCHHLGRNRLFMGIMALITGVQFALLYLGGAVFRTVPLPLPQLLLMLLLGASVLPVDMLRKLVLRWREQKTLKEPEGLGSDAGIAQGASISRT